MNELIKKLIKEAGISTADYYRNLDDPKASYSKGIVDKWSEDFKQQLNLEPYLRIREMDDAQLNKFVESIVQECVEQCWTVSELEYKGYTVSECSKRMRKHFGVAE